MKSEKSFLSSIRFEVFWIIFSILIYIVQQLNTVTLIIFMIISILIKWFKIKKYGNKNLYLYFVASLLLLMWIIGYIWPFIPVQNLTSMIFNYLLLVMLTALILWELNTLINQVKPDP